MRAAVQTFPILALMPLIFVSCSGEGWHTIEFGDPPLQVRTTGRFERKESSLKTDPEILRYETVDIRAEKFQPHIYTFLDFKEAKSTQIMDATKSVHTYLGELSNPPRLRVDKTTISVVDSNRVHFEGLLVSAENTGEVRTYLKGVCVTAGSKRWLVVVFGTFPEAYRFCDDIAASVRFAR